MRLAELRAQALRLASDRSAVSLNGMDIKTLQDALHQAPFRPFNIHADGRIIRVQHPEQVLITPDKTTVVVAGMDGGLAILDLDHISSLSMAPKRGGKAAA